MPRAGCPDERTLQDFVLGQVSEPAAADLESHLAHCPNCGQAMDALAGQDTLTAMLRRYSSPGELPVPVIQLVRRLKDMPAAAEATRTPRPDQTPGQGAAADQNMADMVAEIRAKLAPTVEPGSLGQLAHYRLLHPLGAGGMGVVFEAEDVSLRRRVALKTIRPALADHPAARQRFLREAQALAGLAHDHIVPVYQYGEDRGIFFLAMALLRGETLEAWLARQGRLSPAEVLRIGRDTATGLAAAHERGMIHRDIKPSNLWLEADSGRVRILDFGLARIADESGGLTSTGAVVGTPQYMAPEQVDGQPTAQSDLFSLGCVLYRASTGLSPFQGGSTLQILRSLERDQPRPPRTLCPEMPAALSDLVLQLLAKKPEDRPRSARVVAESLARISAGIPWCPGSQDSEPRRRWPRLKLMASTLVLLGLAGAIFIFALSGQRPSTTQRTTQATRTAAPLMGPGPVEAMLGMHLAEAGPVVCSADGQYALTGSLDATMRLWNLTSRRMERTFGEAGTGWVCAVALSPDSRQALSAEVQGQKVRLWDVASGREMRRLHRRGERVRGVGFVPGGPRALSVSGADDQVLRLWDVAKDHELQRFKGHTDRITQALLSSDGRWILSGSRDGTARLWDVATGQEQYKIATGAAVRSLALAGDGPCGLVGDEEGNLRFWSLQPNERRSLNAWFVSPVEAIAFAPDGHHLLTAQLNGEVGLWDLEDHAKWWPATVPQKGRVGGIAFTRDGRQAVFTSAKTAWRLRLPF